MKYQEITLDNPKYFSGRKVNVKVGAADAIGPLWDQFHAETDEINRISDGWFIGYQLYNEKYGNGELFTYFALVEVKEPQEGYEFITLNPGKYLQFTINFKDIPNEIEKMYQFINDNNIDIKDHFDFELYPKSFTDGEQYDYIYLVVKI